MIRKLKCFFGFHDILRKEINLLKTKYGESCQSIYYCKHCERVISVCGDISINF